MAKKVPLYPHVPTKRQRESVTRKLGLATQTLTITVRTLMVPYQYEVLEDALRDFFESRRIKATIDDSATGNTTVTRN